MARFDRWPKHTRKQTNRRVFVAQASGLGHGPPEEAAWTSIRGPPRNATSSTLGSWVAAWKGLGPSRMIITPLCASVVMIFAARREKNIFKLQHCVSDAHEDVHLTLDTH